MGLKVEDTAILDKAPNCCNGVSHTGSPKTGDSKDGKQARRKGKDDFEETPLLMALSTYLSYVILGIFGHIRDFMRSVGLEEIRTATEKDREEERKDDTRLVCQMRQGLSQLNQGSTGDKIV